MAKNEGESRGFGSIKNRIQIKIKPELFTQWLHCSVKRQGFDFFFFNLTIILSWGTPLKEKKKRERFVTIDAKGIFFNGFEKSNMFKITTMN